MRSMLLGVGLTVLLAIPAVAQTNSANQNSSPATTGSIASQSDSTQNPSTPIRQQVQQNLSKAGFTDIKIMPESFLVRAKDPSGNAVMMVINPDSVTAVTFGPNSTTNSNGTPNQNSAQSNGNRSNR
jgi:hypothetical protein